jgi:hypothetical protein
LRQAASVARAWFGTGTALVQEFVTQPTVEAFDEGILGRRAGRDVVPVDLAVVGKGQDRVRGDLGPIVADYGSWLAERPMI